MHHWASPAISRFADGGLSGSTGSCIVSGNKTRVSTLGLVNFQLFTEPLIRIGFVVVLSGLTKAHVLHVSVATGIVGTSGYQAWPLFFSLRRRNRP